MPPAGAGRPQAVDGDVRRGGRPHRPPEELAHEIGVAPPGGPLEHPSEEVGVGRDVVERAAVPAVGLGEAPEEGPQVRGFVPRREGGPSPAPCGTR